MKNIHKKRAEELVAAMTAEEKTAQLTHNCSPIERLHIRGYCYWNEGLHGVGRAGTASVFPQAIALAATFDPQLVREIGTAIGYEARAKYNASLGYPDSQIYQGLHLWSPNVNIFRDPRWGRGQETYGEDPFLTSKTAAAYIRGAQKRVGGVPLTDCTVKHFVAHSGPEEIRHGFDSRVGEKDFYETYSRAFEYVIRRARPAGVMGAYNSVNGELCCGSRYLIEEIVRKKFGHRGYYISDCGAVDDINACHKKTASAAESAALALDAGCDLHCGGTAENLRAALEKGLIDEKRLDTALIRIFESRFRLGTMDKNCPLNEIGTDYINCKKHRSLNKRAARESIVLLKNDGILPIDLSRYRSVAVVGNNADNVAAMVGNYNGTPYLPDTFLRAMDTACKKKGVRLSYARGCVAGGEVKSWLEQPLREAVCIARQSELVILVLGIDNTLEGEEGDAYNSDAAGDKKTLSYSLSQLELIREMQKTGKPTVLVNISGSPMQLRNDFADAIVQQFYGGQYGGEALADILLGKACPCGKLPVSFYKDERLLPPIETYSMAGRTYRYGAETISYPFGYGLTYTDFRILAAEYADGAVRADIFNAGNLNGKNVVQIYVRYHEAFATPQYELAGFRKVYLKAGERKKVTVPPENIVVYDENGKKGRPKNGYVLTVTTDHPLCSDNKLEIKVDQ